MMRKLFVAVGFGWAVRILAFVMLSSLLLCYAVMQLDLPQRKPGPLFKVVFLKDASYFVFTLGISPLFLYKDFMVNKLSCIISNL